MDNVQPGQMLGQYRIINQVGEGGMATVYKAYHAGTDRYVAVKVLPPEFARSASFKGRFQQEARLIASLEHPHILPIHDVGESDGVHFFVMRFLDTGTLTNRMAAGQLSLAEIDKLFSQITDALGYAHQRGIVHRDIKPSNVLIDSRGDVFLTDFGIAKILEGGSSKFTTTGAITGTPAYMSPEQAQGDAVDQRSDIYSLGIVLYEMLTGRVPFEAETPLAVALKHISAPLPLPSAINPGIDPEIEKVVLKCLSKDKNDRYANCAELLSAWRQAYATATAPGRASVIKHRTPPKLAASTQIGSLAAAQSASQPALPRPSRLPVGIAVAVGGGIAILLCVGVLVTGGFLLSQGGLGFLPGAKTSTPVALVGPGDPTPDGSSAAEASPPAGTQAPNQATISLPAITPTAVDNPWHSWTGGDTIYNVIVQGDTLFTIGPGALTQWNASDGSVVRQLTTQDGLPGDPNDIVMGDDGSLWVSTVRGLARWQGSKLSLYGSDDGLGSDTVVPLLRLHDGRLLAGTLYSGINGEGLSVFENGKWSFWPGFPSASPDTEGKLSTAVNTILEAPDNTLWVGTDKGLGHWDGANWQIYETKDGLPDDSILHLSFSSTGKLLIGTAVGAAIYDGQTFRAFSGESAPNYRVYGIAQAADGYYWFAASGGVYRFDAVTEQWKSWNTTDSAMLTYDAYGGKFLGNGNFVIGTDGNGLVQFTNDGPQTNWKVPNQPVAGGEYLGIGLAPTGLLWIGGNRGIDAIDPQTETWQETLQDTPGSPLGFDPQGNLWASHTSPSGITILAADGTRTELTDRQGLEAEQVVNDVTFEADGSAWLATSAGLAFFDGQTVKVVATGQELGFPSAIVQRVFRASDNAIWATGERLVARRKPDGSVETFKAGQPFDTDDVTVWTLTEDKSGTVWLGTVSYGVFSYSPEGVWKQYLPGDPGVTLPDATTYSIAVAPDGSLWFGTYGGLAHYANGKWSSIKAGPTTYVNPIINQVYVTNDGKVWLATQGGVSRLKP